MIDQTIQDIHVYNRPSPGQIILHPYKQKSNLFQSIISGQSVDIKTFDEYKDISEQTQLLSLRVSPKQINSQIHHLKLSILNNKLNDYINKFNIENWRDPSEHLCFEQQKDLLIHSLENSINSFRLNKNNIIKLYTLDDRVKIASSTNRIEYIFIKNKFEYTQLHDLINSIIQGVVIENNKMLYVVVHNIISKSKEQYCENVVKESLKSALCEKFPLDKKDQNSVENQIEDILPQMNTDSAQIEDPVEIESRGVGIEEIESWDEDMKVEEVQSNNLDEKYEYIQLNQEQIQKALNNENTTYLERYLFNSIKQIKQMLKSKE